MTTEPPDCFDLPAALLPLAEARRRVLAGLAPLPRTETVALAAAFDRVSAAAVVSPINVPPHINSAMDGYAVAGADLPDTGPKAFQVVGLALAGRPYGGTLQRGQCVQVMTGAVMPASTDTVIIQENVARDGDRVTIGPGHRSGANVRQAGEDIAAGNVVLAAGRRIGPAEVGVLASLGLANVELRHRPRVAVLSTGDELCNAGEPLVPGAIYDSNRFVIAAMLRRLGMAVTDLGIVPDRRDAVRAALIEAAHHHDALITSGGVSTGSADYVTDTLRELGELEVWRIAVRPGRPFAYGRLGNTPFFGLPGNPVAVMVTFYLMVQPALRRLAGETELSPELVVSALCTTALRKRRGRTEVYRAVLERDADGRLTVRSTGRQGSGLLHSMSVANCFIILGDAAGDVVPGTVVPVQPFHGLT